MAIEPRVLPEPERNWKRINVDLAPPCGLIPLAMNLAVVDATQRDRELVTDPAPQRTRLDVAEVMRV